MIRRAYRSGFVQPGMVLAVALAWPSGGCAGVLSAAERTSDALARTVNAAQRGAIAAYDAAKEDAVREVARRSGTRDEAEAALDGVRAKWRPVWDAYAVAGAAHGALVTLLEEYRSSGVSEGDLRITRLADAIHRVHEAWRRVQAALCSATGRTDALCVEPPEEEPEP